jgi:hypothetical protein
MEIYCFYLSDIPTVYVEVSEHLVVGDEGAVGQAAVAPVEDGDGVVARAQLTVDGQADPADGQLEAQAVLVPAGQGYVGFGAHRVRVAKNN